MNLFNQIGEELGEALAAVRQNSVKTGLSLQRAELVWQFRTNGDLSAQRLPSNRDLYLSGNAPPQYFRVRVTVEQQPAET